MNGASAGPDGMLCTADDVQVTLNAAQATNALRETVGHECGHGCHLEHNFCVGDRHLIAENQGCPNTITVTTGPGGLCNTTAVADDVQMIPIGQGQPNAQIITDGGDGLQTTPLSDDTVQGNTITAGPDGIAQTTATGNDVQVIPAGQGQPNADCINTGSDGISNSAAIGGDTQRIPVGQGEPNQTGIDDGGDGVLSTTPFGDDQLIGLSITTGADGILQTVADIGNQGVISIMTSDVLVPVPNTYSTDDLDQVRIHVKHP